MGLVREESAVVRHMENCLMLVPDDQLITARSLYADVVKQGMLLVAFKFSVSVR